MGTHSAMVVRDVDGTIHRWERTLDGGLIIDEFHRWIERGEYKKTHPDPMRIGYGTIEEGNQGEGDQEYYVAIDLRDMHFATSFGPANNSQFRMWQKLIDAGWTINLADDLLEAIWNPDVLQYGDSKRSPEAQEFDSK